MEGKVGMEVGLGMRGESWFLARTEATSSLPLPHLQRNRDCIPFIHSNQCGLSAYCIHGTMWEKREGRPQDGT